MSARTSVPLTIVSSTSVSRTSVRGTSVSRTNLSRLSKPGNWVYLGSLATIQKKVQEPKPWVYIFFSPKIYFIIKKGQEPKPGVYIFFQKFS